MFLKVLVMLFSKHNFSVDIGRSFFRFSKITYFILCNLDCHALSIARRPLTILPSSWKLSVHFFWFEASLGYEFWLLNRWPCHPQDPIGGAKEVKSRQIFFSTPTCAGKKLNAWLMTYTTIMNSWPLVQGVLPYVRTNMNI